MSQTENTPPEQGTLIQEFLQNYAAAHDTTVDALNDNLKNSKGFTTLFNDRYMYTRQTDATEIFSVLTDLKNEMAIVDTVVERNGVVMQRPVA